MAMASARKVEPHDGVGGEGGEEHGQHRGDERDADRVAQCRRELRVLEDASVVAERRVPRDEAAVSEAILGLQ
jgi:hypothetical protein